MNNAPLGIDLYLQPTFFVDSEHPDIRRFVKNTIGNEIDKTKIIEPEKPKSMWDKAKNIAGKAKENVAGLFKKKKI